MATRIVDEYRAHDHYFAATLFAAAVLGSPILFYAAQTGSRILLVLYFTVVMVAPFIATMVFRSVFRDLNIFHEKIREIIKRLSEHNTTRLPRGIDGKIVVAKYAVGSIKIMEERKIGDTITMDDIPEDHLSQTLPFEALVLEDKSNNRAFLFRRGSIIVFADEDTLLNIIEKS